MNKFKPSEPGDYYKEVDGEVLPPYSDDYYDDNNNEPPRELDEKIGPKERGEFVADVFLKYPDELTREVFPSDDMTKAYEVARRIMGLDSKEPQQEHGIKEPEVVADEEIEQGQTRSVRWKKQNGRNVKYTVPVAFVKKKINGKWMYLESKNTIPETGAGAFLEMECNELKKLLDGGEGVEL